MADSVKHSYIRQALADSCLIWQLSDLTAVRSDSCQTWQLSKWKISGKISSPLHTAKIHEAQLELCFSKKITILQFKLTNQRTRKATQFNAAIVFSKRYCIWKVHLKIPHDLTTKQQMIRLWIFDQQRKNDNSVVLFSYGEKMSII